jgi:hypothetical protein
LLARHGGLVRGHTFEAAVAPRVRWRFVTGDRTNVNRVQVGPPRSQSQVNTGIGFFFHEDVMYDIAGGRLGFRPAAASLGSGS